MRVQWWRRLGGGVAVLRERRIAVAFPLARLPAAPVGRRRGRVRFRRRVGVGRLVFACVVRDQP